MSDQKVKLVKYTAKWCGPCKVYKPILKRLVTNYPSIELEDVDIDTKAGEARADKAGVTGIPRVDVFVDGKKRVSLTGTRSYEDLAADLGKAGIWLEANGAVKVKPKKPKKKTDPKKEEVT